MFFGDVQNVAVAFVLQVIFVGKIVPPFAFENPTFFF